ncbi:hypothetical protein [Deinococcus pimensis]|uniref:hypothetical protein n=1 Tax=Deinococcus pimensis TaxID=309888 RepID=UPI000485ADA2|nr:hypothetical protein [Deinococcus pimensis]
MTKTTCASPDVSSATLAALIETRLHNQVRGVTVVKAPPGTGKSTATRQALQELLQAGTVQRVLWAVHATRDAGSLGQECLQEFQQLGVEVSIVYGKAAFKGKGRQQKYAAQMNWPNAPSVKIISFSHLPLLFGPEPPGEVLTPLCSVDLLIIDEDPHATLLLPNDSSQDSEFRSKSKPLTAGAFEQLSSSSRLCGRIAMLLRNVAQNNVPQQDLISIPDLKKSTWTYSFTGAAFLRRLGQSWSEEDWGSFEAALKSLGVNHAGVIAGALRDDLAAPELGSARFGLLWTTGRAAKQPVFRFDVCLPLPSLPNTLVLDAYAEKELYDAVFPGRPVRFEQLGQPHVLDIEWCDRLRLDALNLQKGMDEKHLQIAEEIVTLLDDSDRSVTVLTNKAMVEPTSPWAGYIRQALSLAGKQGEAERIASRYYHAGRGINACSGHHILALTQPKLPALHREHTMAALFPHSATQRAWAHEVYERTELLQMLERTRQFRHSGARIITAFKPDLPRELATVRPYRTTLHFVRKSTNPRWRDAIITVGQELLDALGGIPLHAFYTLGLIENPDLKIPQNILDQRLHHALRSVSTGPELSHWLEHRKLQRYGTVEPYRGGKVHAELQVLSKLGVQPQRARRISVDRTQVHAAGFALDAESFDCALQRFFGLWRKSQ